MPSDQQQLFKETHQKYQQTFSTKNETTTTELKKEIKQMQNEKEQLENRLNKMQLKIENDKNVTNNKEKFQQILELTSNLRVSQEEESNLLRNAYDQRKKHRMSSKTMHELQSDKSALEEIFNEISEHVIPNETNAISEDSAQHLIEMWKEKNMQNEKELEHVHNEYKEHHKMLQELLNITHSDTKTDNELSSLRNEINELSHEIGDLENQRDSLLQALDSKLAIYKKRAFDMAKNKTVLLNKIKQIQDEIKDVRTEIMFRCVVFKDEMDKMHINGRRPMSEKEMKEYLVSLQEKKHKYEQCQNNLQRQSHEIGILERTEEILKSRHENLQQYIEYKEKEESLAEQQKQLVSISAMKSEIDQSKGMTLNSLSEVAKRVNAELQLRKNKLVPLIKQFRIKREEFEELQKEYKDKKQIYDTIKMTYEKELQQLQTSIDETGHDISMLNQDINQTQKQLKDKKELLANISSDEKCKEYKTIYENDTAKLLQKSKRLRQEQKIVIEKQGKDEIQKEYFNRAKQLMQIKLEILEAKTQTGTTTNENGADCMIIAGQE
ncbi:hypothetical protein RFI_07375 [Reticulomyxa filosa]|uniref:Uncharacterized protein n=1 Tax=Reticulomyxa filosa TaxID=46433 RepID=X6NWS8_RETFI|nr:hypothetical protein RFI_07375 [Reticulomyxa filosa]|eukprot:ETO29747.1 hypothetical protein RFI_07375 [Reticulomyxa filosa]